MTRNSFINSLYNRIHKSHLTSGIYADENWEHLHNLTEFMIKEIEKINVAKSLNCDMHFIRSEYDGILGECGHKKIYEYEISDDINFKRPIKVEIYCTFCGKMNDPMGMYDLTVLMN